MTETLDDTMGRVTVGDDFARIEFERHFGHPLDSVWKAITDQEQLSRWYLCKVKIIGGPDGRIDLWFGRIHVYGAIRIWEPPRLFEHEWNIDPRTALPKGERTIVRWELEEEDRGTRVRLSHLNFTRETVLGASEELDPATSDHLILQRLRAFLNSEPLNAGMEQILWIREEYRRLCHS